MNEIFAITNSDGDSASCWYIPFGSFTSAKLFHPAVDSTFQFFMVYSMNLMTSLRFRPGEARRLCVLQAPRVGWVESWVRPNEFVRHGRRALVGLRADDVKAVSIERLCLSLSSCRKTFNLKKVNKTFVPEPILCFRIPIYVYVHFMDIMSISHIRIMGILHKEDLALNDLPWLICHKTQPNPTKSYMSNTYVKKWIWH